MQVEIIQHIAGTKLGEGPVWDYRSNLLRWVDIPNGLIHNYKPADKSHWTFKFDQMGKVVCFDSKTDKKLEQIDVPAQCTTCCTFGDENLDTLYITSGAKEGDELGGALFAVKPGVKGRRVDLFKI